MKLLVVEDEPDLADMIARLLRGKGYVVDIAVTVEEAREALASFEYGVVILDRMLPDGDGQEILADREKYSPKTKYLILSALGDLDDRVSGLYAGADDYLPKPFEPDELIARLFTLLRRPSERTENKVIEAGKVVYDVTNRTIMIKGETVVLPRRELVIFEVLIKRLGHVVPHDTILDRAYGYDDEFESNTLAAQLSRLRKRLKDQHSGLHIEAIRGVGYMLKEI